MFDDFIKSLPDAAEPELPTGDKICKACKYFTVLNVVDPLIEGVGECSYWEEGVTPDDTCEEFVSLIKS